MPQNSIPSYVIIGEQNDHTVVASSMQQTVYQFREHSLQKQSSLLIPERFHRNPSPLKGMLGWVTAGGGISLDFHVEDMLVWFKHWMHDDSISSSDFTAQEVYGDGGGAGKAYTSPVSLDTQPTATSPASDPGKLIVTFSTTVTGTAVIVGTDQNDTAITETLTYSAAASQTSTYYYKSVTSITLTGISGGTLLITCDRNTYTHTISLGDTPLEGLTMEIVKGAIPNTMIGAIINEATLELGPIMGLNVSGILARTVNLRENISGGSSPTSVAAYADMSEEVYPEWGYAVQIDSVQHPVETASVRMSNSLDHPDRKQATRYRPKPHQTGDREFGLSFTCDYEASGYADFDNKFETDQVVAVTITGVHMPYAGPEYSYTLTFPRCQVLAYADPTVGSKGNLIQEVTLHPIRSVGASSSDEMSVQIVSTESGI